MLYNFKEISRFDQRYIITNMGIHKVMETIYKYQHIIIQYKLAYAHIYTLTYKSYTSVSNNFFTLNQDQN